MDLVAPPNPAVVRSHVARTWAESAIPALHEYIAIPNVSVAYDPQWKANGHMDRAVALIHDWCAARAIVGLSIEVVELP